MYTKAQLQDLTRAAARRYNLREDIALKQIHQESGFNPYAKSGKANGIAQFTPGTAARFGLSNPFDPVASLDAWGKYMSFLLRRYNGNYAFALAGYDAGEGNVDKHHGVPPFRETQNYVRTILDGTPIASAGAYVAAHGEQVTGGLASVFLIGLGAILIIRNGGK